MIVNKKRIVINTFLLYGKTLITLIISLFTTRLVLAALGELDFGVYGTVGGAIAMLSVLNLAMASATQRFMNYAEGGDDKERLISIFNNTVLLHIALGLLIVLIMAALYYPLFNGIFNIPEDRVTAAKYIYLFLAISTFFTITSVPYTALITAHEDFLYFSIVSIVIAILKLIAAIILTYYMQDRLILYGLMLAILSIINRMVQRIYCKIKYEECIFSPRRYANFGVAKEIGVFSGWNFIGSMAQMAGNHGSNILMNHFFGAAIIASKNIGDQISTQVSVLTNNMTKALAPSIVKSEGGGNRQMMLHLAFISGRFGMMLFLLLAIPFMFNAEGLLGLWLKTIPGWAVLFCQLQVFRVMMEQLFGCLGTMLIAEGTIRQINVINLMLGVVTFISIWVAYSCGLDAKWHYYLSIGVWVVTSGIIKIILCHKFCNMKIDEFLRIVIKPTFLVTLIAIPFCYFTAESLKSMHVLVPTLIQMGGMVILILFVGLSRNERELLFSKTRNIVKRF